MAPAKSDERHQLMESLCLGEAPDTAMLSIHDALQLLKLGGLSESVAQEVIGEFKITAKSFMEHLTCAKMERRPTFSQQIAGAQISTHEPDAHTDKESNERNYHVQNLTEMLDQFNAAPVMGAMVRQGVPDAIGDDEEVLVQDIASRAGIANVRFLYKVMRYLTSFHIFEETCDRRFRHSNSSRALRKGGELHLRSIWRTSPENLMSMIWTDKLWHETTGRSAFELGMGSEYYSYIANYNPEQETVFGKYMKQLMKLTIPGIVQGYTWPHSGDIVDLGGGTGDLLNQIALTRPDCTCHLLDTPTVINEARHAGIVNADNIVLQECDFFQRIPVEADLFVMKRILHNWDDANCIRILRQIAAAAKPGCKVLIIDFVITGQRNAFDEMLRQDINMQLLFSGEERTFDEFKRIFDHSGFMITSPPFDFEGGPYKGIEIVKVDSL
eukprot:TRINITY_DN189_c0_g1_i2.p1 TRINITY_DN189_c0_g1~~TRINITY_DN189_c0_g1_i2.p1  ORF type:complete len:441 (-),score=67.98 TRINITY_DN189_c0_g1_i2:89-1411(-)